MWLNPSHIRQKAQAKNGEITEIVAKKPAKRGLMKESGENYRGSLMIFAAGPLLFIRARCADAKRLSLADRLRRSVRIGPTCSGSMRSETTCISPDGRTPTNTPATGVSSGLRQEAAEQALVAIYARACSQGWRKSACIICRMCHKMISRPEIPGGNTEINQ